MKHLWLRYTISPAEHCTTNNVFDCWQWHERKRANPLGVAGMQTQDLHRIPVRHSYHQAMTEEQHTSCIQQHCMGIPGFFCGFKLSPSASLSITNQAYCPIQWHLASHNTGYVILTQSGFCEWGERAVAIADWLIFCSLSVTQSQQTNHQDTYTLDELQKGT